MIIIPDEMEDEFISDIVSLMCQYHYNSQGSDYSCAFCHKYANNNLDIQHRSDCLGKRLLALPRKDT